MKINRLFGALIMLSFGVVVTMSAMQKADMSKRNGTGPSRKISPLGLGFLENLNKQESRNMRLGRIASGGELSQKELEALRKMLELVRTNPDAHIFTEQDGDEKLMTVDTGQLEDLINAKLEENEKVNPNDSELKIKEVD